MAGIKKVVNHGEGAQLRLVEDTVRVLATAGDSDAAYEVFELQGPRDSGPPLHAHPWNEAYFFLDGEVEVALGEQKLRATSGCFVNIPAGEPHNYRVVSETARFLVITNPSGAGDFFVELDRETNGSKDDLEKIVAIAARHGVTVQPPAI